MQWKLYRQTRLLFISISDPVDLVGIDIAGEAVAINAARITTLSKWDTDH